MTYLFALFGGAALTALCLPCVRKLQQTSYRPERGYLYLFYTPYFLALCLLQTACLFLAFVPFAYMSAAYCAMFAAVAVFFAAKRKRPPLKYTRRVVRLLTVLFVCFFAAALFVPLYVFPVFCPLVCLTAFFLTLPAELLINGYYVRKAKRKLESIPAVRIAVTGSFGKTGVKTILSQLLDGAVATEGSCNTPLGIAKFVNGRSFDGVRYLIFEFGARKKGDVAKLCKMVQPHFGVLTGITAQHLETFGSLQNVIDAKCELPEYLQKEDVCVIGPDERARQCADRGVCRKILTDESKFHLLSVSPEGTRFSCETEEGVFEAQTALLGVAHFKNIALALTVCFALGQEALPTLQKCASLRQIPHRMEVLHGKVTVIDDSYNANIEGVRLCCETLARLDGFKIALSQGIAECGKQSREINESVGRQLAAVCDVVVTCGPQKEYIAKGAGEKAVRAADLADAVATAERYYTDNTVVLFQNDMPDAM